MNAAKLVGDVGESIVYNIFSSNGQSVSMSTDCFDQEKDMTVDGQTVEIKTLIPIYKYNSFCLPQRQSKKCEEVDRLIFVKIPTTEKSKIQVYESIRDPDTQRRYDFREVFNKEACQFYRISSLQKISTIDDPELCHKLWSLSTSTYKVTTAWKKNQ